MNRELGWWPPVTGPRASTMRAHHSARPRSSSSSKSTGCSTLIQSAESSSTWMTIGSCVANVLNRWGIRRPVTASDDRPRPDRAVGLHDVLPFAVRAEAGAVTEREHVLPADVSAEHRTRVRRPEPLRDAVHRRPRRQGVRRDRDLLVVVGHLRVVVLHATPQRNIPRHPMASMTTSDWIS